MSANSQCTQPQEAASKGPVLLISEAFSTKFKAISAVSVLSSITAYMMIVLRLITCAVINWFISMQNRQKVAWS